MSEHEENVSRVLAYGDLMYRQLLDIRADLAEIEGKLGPYFRIISELSREYLEARAKLEEK